MTEAFMCVLTLPLYASNCHTFYMVNKEPKGFKTEILAYQVTTSAKDFDLPFPSKEPKALEPTQLVDKELKDLALTQWDIARP